MTMGRRRCSPGSGGGLPPTRPASWRSIAIWRVLHPAPTTGRGWPSCLSGVSAFSGVVVRDAESPLQLIPAGRDRESAAPLLASARFDAVLEALDQNYDIVLLDLGMASPETVPLVLKSHATLIVVSGARAQDAALLCGSLAAAGVRAARFVIDSGAPAPIARRA